VVELAEKDKPDERAYHACAWDSKRNQMWIYGGCNSAFEGWTDLWSFDPETRKWTGHDPGETHPNGRLGATLHYYPATDSLILIGGAEGFGGNEPAIHEVWTYSIKDKKWSEKKDNAPHRWLAATTLDPKNGLITLFGGIDDQSQVHDETYVYDIEKDKWRDAVRGKRITNSLPAVWDADQARVIVCAGTCPGENKTAYDDVFTFDPQKKEWKELTVEGDKPEPRAYHSAIWVPELHSMIIFGGTTNQFSDPSVENKVWTLRLPAK
jgi:N-acetylneuraminic acid mutarotase